jgi:hypothetical protein
MASRQKRILQDDFSLGEVTAVAPHLTPRMGCSGW